MKCGRFSGDPGSEFLQPGMGAQGFDCVVGPGQLGLGQRGMDLVMADLVQQNRRTMPPAFQFWDQMMQRLLGLWWDRAVA